MQQAKRVAKNTAFLYAQMGITIFISLYATRLILAALGAEDFGIFNVVGGAIAMLTFLNAAMAAASQRFMSYANGQGDFNKQKKIFNISIVLHFFIALIVVVLLEIVGYFLFNGILKISPERIDIAKLIFQFLIASTFFTIISVPYDAVINAHENMLLVAILRIVESVLRLAIAFYITYTLFDKLYMYGLLMAILSILLLVFRQIYCHKKYEEVVLNYKKYKDKSLFKEMTGFASWSFLGSAAGMISNYGQGIVLNAFFGSKVNASQGIANQISGQLGAFSGTMLKALNPVIAKSEGAGNREMLINSVMIGSKFSFFLLSFFAIPVIIEMPFILGLWLKQVPEYAVIFCRLLLLKNILDQLFVTMSSAISAVGKIRSYQIAISILAFFPLIITAILFSFGYHPYVLYIVFIIQGLIRSFGFTLYYVKKYVNLSIRYFLKNVLLPCFLVSTLVLLTGYLIQISLTEGYTRLIIILCACATVFFISIFTFGLHTKESELIKGLIFPIVKKYLKINLKK